MLIHSNNPNSFTSIVGTDRDLGLLVKQGLSRATERPKPRHKPGRYKLRNYRNTEYLLMNSILCEKAICPVRIKKRNTEMKMN